MTPLPLVSVVIPAFNVERFIGEAIASALAQDYPSLEVIVIDDGSTDGTAAVAARFEGIRLLRQANLGVSAARNAGLAIAAGEFVAFLDADDTWGPEKTRLQAEYLAAHPGTGLVLCGQRHVSAPGEKIQHEATEGPSVVPSSWMVRASVLAMVGPFDETLQVTEDLDWLVRARDLGLGTHTLPEILLTKRARVGSLTARHEQTRSALLGSLRASVARKRALGEPMPDRSISVVIPAFNAERYLAEAIESVLAQSVPVAEVIIVDDGSTDGTASLAGSFGPPVRCVQRENGGIGAARNTGVALCTGEWLGFLDADDLWAPGRLEAQFAASLQSGAAIVFGQVRQFISPDLDLAERARLAVDERIQPGLFASGMLIRRETFLRVGPFSETARVGEFVDWYGRALDLGLSMHVSPELVLERRIHANNTGRGANEARIDYATVLRQRLARLRAGERLMRVHGRLPNETETLALRAALWPDERALDTWTRFLAAAGGLDAVAEPAFAALPAVYRNLAALTTEAPELARLKGIYRQTWYRNQVLTSEAAGLVRALALVGIEALVLKGGAILAHYDPDAGARPMGDIDILVPHAQAARAAAVIAAERWATTDPIRPAPRGGASPRTRLQQNIRFSHGLGYQSARGANVDLHWLSLMEDPRPASDAPMWRSAASARLGGAACLVPAPEEMLVHVCVHGLRWVGPPTLTWVLDAATVLRVAPSLDWDAVVAVARRRDVLGILHDALPYLASELSLPVPTEVLANTTDDAQLSVSERVIRWHQRGGRTRRVWAVRFTSYVAASGGSPWYRRVGGVPAYVAHMWGLEERRSIPGEAIRRLGTIRRRPARTSRT